MSRFISTIVHSDRVVVGASLAGITVLAWIYLFREAEKMSQVDMGMAMPQMSTWDVGHLGFLVIMWSIMMVAMMVPSVTPMVMMFTTINRKRQESDRRDLLPIGIFVAGYLIAWAAFSIGVSVAQWGLHAAALLSADDDEHDADPRGNTADRWRYLPVDAAQVCLPRALPNADVISHDLVASRPARCTHHGASPWIVLRRMLLGSDGAAFRGRGYERAVGGRDRCLRLHRESCTARRVHWPCGRRAARRSGSLGSDPRSDVVTGLPQRNNVEIPTAISNTSATRR